MSALLTIGTGARDYDQARKGVSAASESKPVANAEDFSAQLAREVVSLTDADHIVEGVRFYGGSSALQYQQRRHCRARRPPCPAPRREPSRPASGLQDVGKAAAVRQSQSRIARTDGASGSR
jgi:hypothetical protein